MNVSECAGVKMGVRGLTTFIAANAELYLKAHELHDTNIVIDGDNLCIQLFKKTLLTSSPLGGNYDVFYGTVLDFFKMLSMCNVVPYVLLDGGYEARKMATVKSRMIQTIHGIKKVSLWSTVNAKPLMLREVFVDALQDAGVKFMRCAFEADDEVAILARKLGCPVLSYDSDFYIHNGQYIPYVTVTHKVYRKVTDKTGENFEIGIVEWNRSKTSASQRVKFVAQYGDESIVNSDEAVTYYYLDCSLYTLESLIGPLEQIGKDMVPLFAVLLGNDYIERQVLAPFYRTIRSGRVNRKMNGQRRRINIILKWLKNHTVQSATRTIVHHVKEQNKKHIYRQILTAMQGYNCEDCLSFEYFGFKNENSNDGEFEDEEIEKNVHAHLEADGHLDKPIAAAEEETSTGNDATESGEENSKSEEGCTKQEATDEEDTDGCEHVEDGEASSGTDQSDEDFEIAEPLRNKFTDDRWPEWFKELYRGAKVPRFMADLLHSNLYLNYPQIQDITKPDSNTISLPIVRLIFTLLKASSSEMVKQFKYISRKVKVVGLTHELLEDVKLPDGFSFDSSAVNNDTIMAQLFQESNVMEWEDLFKTVRNLPANLQLYFLAIIYWAKNCPEVNLVHVQALVVCILQLQIVDSSLKSKNRDVKLFQKQHMSYLEEQRKLLKGTSTSRDKDAERTGDISRAFYNKLSSTISRSELMLVYETLIIHFSPAEKLNRKNASVDQAIVHTFAHFQSVCYHFYALVPVLGYPFANMRMHELFNSMFVYNVYEAMKSRTDPHEYACTTFYRYSESLRTAFCRMVRFVETYVPELSERKRSVKSKAKAAAAKNKAQKVKPANEKNATPRTVNDVADQNDSSHTDNGFVDMNNRFSGLLLNS